MARYGYDLFDRRIWKEQYRDRSGHVLAQARRSYYLYADEGLIAESRQAITLDANESVSASAEPAIATQYGPRPDSKFTTGVLFVKTQNSHGGDTVAYYHHDHLQTPIQATDKQGNVVWSAQYNVFGRATITTPSATPDRPTISSDLRLPGQVEDAETGLYYNYYRYYNPSTGRYITADPISIDEHVQRWMNRDATAQYLTRSRNKLTAITAEPIRVDEYVRRWMNHEASAQYLTRSRNQLTALDSMTSLASIGWMPLELNPYRYALQNPLRYIDPLGLATCGHYPEGHPLRWICENSPSNEGKLECVRKCLRGALPIDDNTPDLCEHPDWYYEDHPRCWVECKWLPWPW